MRSPEDYQPVSLETRRIPLLRSVSLLYQQEDERVEEMGINVSMTGMFVRTESPRPVGTAAAFSLSLFEDDEPIEGLAEVMWIRDEAEGDYQPAGMGMRFLKVSGEGRRRIRQAVERLVEETSAPEELRDLRLVVERTLEDIFSARDEEESEDPVLPPALPPALPRGEDAGAVVARSALEAEGLRRRWSVIVPLALILLAAAWFFRGGEPSSKSDSTIEKPKSELEGALVSGASEGTVNLSETAGEAPTAPSARSEPPSPGPGSPAVEAFRTSLEIQSEVAKAVSSWAKAWSDQRASDYLRYYAEDYQPSGGLEREPWEAQRRERLAAPGFIQVSIVDLEVRLLDDDRAEAEFLQSYRSDRYRDSVRKVLTWTHVGDRWRIVDEKEL